MVTLSMTSEKLLELVEYNTRKEFTQHLSVVHGGGLVTKFVNRNCGSAHLHFFFKEDNIQKFISHPYGLLINLPLGNMII